MTSVVFIIETCPNGPLRPVPLDLLPKKNYLRHLLFFENLNNNRKSRGIILSQTSNKIQANRLEKGGCASFLG